MVHSWLAETQPVVFICTDGSGRTNQSRVASTTRILENVGAKQGSIYGRLTDAESYAAILNHDFDLFVGLAAELCSALVEEKIDYVAGDAFEGYNPMHDVCRLVINAAVTSARHSTGREIGNLDFSLITQSANDHEGCHVEGICRILNDATFAQKMAAANGYAELAGEVEAAVNRSTVDALRIECLRPVSGNSSNDLQEKPFYELYGEQQVAAGYYQTVLRYSEHIEPLAEALKKYSEAAHIVSMKGCGMY
jgi:hypothetical protein